MFIGIDVGTTSVKTILIDADQKVVATAQESLTVSRPNPGWSEQNPADWWQATAATLDQLSVRHAVEMSAVAGIGLSGQMHGAVLLDARDEVLRPAMLWNDGRAAAECVEIETACPRARTIAGNIAMPGFTAPKVLWVRHHEPHLFDRIAKILLPKDYVRLLLTGDYISDMSDASGTFWLDVGGRVWSDALLAACSLELSQMPALVEGSQQGGKLRQELANRWGMQRNVVIAGGGGDNAASACGIGAVRPGSAFASLGTSGVLFVANQTFSPNVESAVHAFCHCLPDCWHQMGVILSATDSLNWLARLLQTDPADLTAALDDTLDGPSDTLFLPYLGGERTPYNDVGVRGALLGLAHTSDRRSLTQAVLEGVAFAFRDCLEALREVGTDIAAAAAVGGGARSRGWLQILANVLDRPLELHAESDYGAAFGAARLAMAASTGASPLTIMTPPPVETVIEPQRDQVPLYAVAYGRYRTAYPATKEIFRR